MATNMKSYMALPFRQNFCRSLEGVVCRDVHSSAEKKWIKFCSKKQKFQNFIHILSEQLESDFWILIKKFQRKKESLNIFNEDQNVMVVMQ